MYWKSVKTDRLRAVLPKLWRRGPPQGIWDPLTNTYHEYSNTFFVIFVYFIFVLPLQNFNFILFDAVTRKEYLFDFTLNEGVPAESEFGKPCYKDWNDYMKSVRISCNKNHVTFMFILFTTRSVRFLHAVQRYNKLVAFIYSHRERSVTRAA